MERSVRSAPGVYWSRRYCSPVTTSIRWSQSTAHLQAERCFAAKGARSAPGTREYKWTMPALDERGWRPFKVAFTGDVEAGASNVIEYGAIPRFANSD